jgi:hypothetical protein
MTADKITTSASQPMIWRYHEGAWSHITDPLDGLSPDGDGYEELRLGGFSKADSWGGFDNVVIWEKPRAGEPGSQCWRIDVCIDASNVHTIEVTRLPDLLDVLAKLAPIATAALTSGLKDSLQGAIWNAHEDGKAEHLRRHPELRKRNQKR